MISRFAKIAIGAITATLLVPTVADARPGDWRHNDRHRMERRWDRDHDRRHDRRWEHGRGWERRGWHGNRCRIVWRHHQRVRVCR